MEKLLREGQPLQHARFGVGIATHGADTRTTIDFYEHGVKTFVTSMLEVELLRGPRAGRRHAQGAPRQEGPEELAARRARDRDPPRSTADPHSRSTTGCTAPGSPVVNIRSDPGPGAASSPPSRSA